MFDNIYLNYFFNFKKIFILKELAFYLIEKIHYMSRCDF